MRDESGDMRPLLESSMTATLLQKHFINVLRMLPFLDKPLL
jgi:hypothetical protein